MEKDLITKEFYKILHVQYFSTSYYGNYNYLAVLQNGIGNLVIVKTKQNSGINFRIQSDKGKIIRATINRNYKTPILTKYDIVEP